MAQEIRQFSVTIPAGTAKGDGYTVSLAMPTRVVDQINIKVPPGPRGTMGFAIGAAGQPILPYNQGEYIVTDDEEIKWPLENQIDSGSWELYGYNDGAFDHTVYITFFLSMVTNANNQLSIAPINFG